MTLVLLFCILFTASKATANITVKENATDILPSLEAAQKPFEDKNNTILSKTSTTNNYTNETSDYEESDNSGVIDNKPHPEQKNILRWLPKKKRDPKFSKARDDEKRARERLERAKQRAKDLHAERIAYVTSVMKDNYWTTLYLYGELRRILTTGEIVDDIRALIQTIESSRHNKELKEKVLKCYRDGKKTLGRNVWGGTNNLVIHSLKDPMNGGV
ncbi:hypothetical protein B5X24_HaOG205117 [Helicoverpa armigera]|uniref:Uncharacterized protein n=1 Tax=Helicoverpa armigera TaxID=29058 RepID=A0A2W1BU30_HELAM|nr:hypothetical protein B5X24_HaOG205117 [Helicoverpa armigera]